MLSLLRKLFAPGAYIDYLDRVQGDILVRIAKMSKELEALRAAVAENAAVTESAVALIDGLADRLEAALDKSNDDESDEPIHELLEDLRASSRSLADAVAANTQAGGINPQSGAEGSAGGPSDSPVASTPPDQK